MAASARWTDPAVLAQWLYHFGTLPRSPAIDRDFGPDDDPIAVFGMTARAATRRLLENWYEPSSLPGWYSFARTPVGEQTDALSKLYVSPRPEALSDAFPRIADVFVRLEVRSFKVGRGIHGLLRPDKIVAYSADSAHMEEVAEALCRSLCGCPVQGVPFTAELGGNGLLSSGIDPPRKNGAQASWRSWVTARLAYSLTTHSVMPREEAVAAALAELRLAGVDPDLWRPMGGLVCEASRQ
jgi:hypothetical protein